MAVPYRRAAEEPRKQKRRDSEDGPESQSPSDDPETPEA